MTKINYEATLEKIKADKNFNNEKFARAIKKIIKTEKCDKEKALKFYVLGILLESPDYTPELGKDIYRELEALRKA